MSSQRFCDAIEKEEIFGFSYTKNIGHRLKIITNIKSEGGFHSRKTNSSSSRQLLPMYIRVIIVGNKMKIPTFSYTKVL